MGEEPEIKTPYGKRYSHQHAVYTSKFFRNCLKGYDDVEVLAALHHVPENAPNTSKKYLAKLITLADWLSSGERRDREVDEELGDPSKEPLISIFSRIKIDDKGVEEHYVPISTLNAALDRMFPVKSREAAISSDPKSENSYRSLWEQFKNEIENIDTADLSNQIFYLIEKYTLCIPAATYKDKPDLSLYHHSKSVAAITACLYHLRLPEEKIDQIMNEIRLERYNSDLMKETFFLFIGGDISGIQDFIYSVTSAKALKGLRGRSFYLQLLSETIAKMILSDFNLPETNLLYCSGGHFYLLLPLIKDAEDKLNGIRKRVDKILLTAHKGKLSTIIGLQPISWQDLISFGDVWNRIGGILVKKKKQKFSEFLKDPKDSFEILGPYETGGETKACEICGEEIEKGEQCPLCESFSSLSSKLAKAETIKVTGVGASSLDKMPSSWKEVLEALGCSYSFPEREDKNALCINSTDFVTKYAGYKFIAHSTPMKGKEVMTLEDIADEATGIKKWGVLRADVDNLGRVFKKGLGEDKTISRISMLSYMLSLFFSARVDKIAEEFKNKVYVVYSGGDDLFILGAWSELPKIARRIYEDFRKFTCHNLTLSGGIYLAPSQKFPVYQAANEAGNAVDKAKDDQKNKLTFLDKPISWQDLESISDIAETIRKLLEDYEKRSVPRSLLSTLYSGWQEKELMENKEIPMVRIWRLFYAFKKLMKGYKEDDKQLKELNELLKKVVADFNLMPYLDIATRWADYLTRKEEAKHAL